MKSIIYNGNVVVGYNYNLDTKEADELGVDYILVEEIPEIILTCPNTHYVERNEEGILTLVEHTPVEPVKADRVTELENELALTQSALNELIMLVLGGGE